MRAADAADSCALGNIGPALLLENVVIEQPIESASGTSIPVVHAHGVGGDGVRFPGPRPRRMRCKFIPHLNEANGAGRPGVSGIAGPGPAGRFPGPRIKACHSELVPESHNQLCFRRNSKSRTGSRGGFELVPLISMVTIIFESHGTTFDNEVHRSSGWSDVSLSPLGERQSVEMGQGYHDIHLDAVYCSALQRSFRSAEIAFKGRTVPIYKDRRLDECNYGDMDGKPSEVVDPEKRKHVTKPFPNGESYEQTSARMMSFLEDVKQKHRGQTIMVVGHRATQYGLDHWIKGKPLVECITAPWKWQPGWTYQIE